MSDAVPSTSAPISEPATPKRGGCLSAYLVAMFIANPLTGLYYLYLIAFPRIMRPMFRVTGIRLRPPRVNPLPDMMRMMARNGLPGWVVVYLLIGLSFANLVFAIAVWRWKRWGMYGFVASALVILVINLQAGVGPHALLGLAGPLILAFLLRDAWPHMD